MAQEAQATGTEMAMDAWSVSTVEEAAAMVAVNVVILTSAAPSAQFFHQVVEALTQILALLDSKRELITVLSMVT